MFRTGVAVIALSLGAASAASAQAALDPVLSALQGQGFGDFEIKNADGTVKVEARKGTVERELVYDARSGRLLSDEVGRSDDRSPVAPASPQLRGIYDSLRAKGYTSFDVEQTGNRIEVDVLDGGVERDLAFDARTGALVSQRVDDDHRAGSDDRLDRGDDDHGRNGGRGSDDDGDDNDDRGGSGHGGSGGRSGASHDDDDGGRGGNGGSGRGGHGGSDDDDGDDD